MDNRKGKDAAPAFTITADLGQFKYHAVLMEPVWVPTKLVFDVRMDAKERTVEGTVEKLLSRGIYGFQRVEDRDKFTKRCNAVADAVESPICSPVTLSVESMENATTLSVTGPVGPSTL